LNNAIQGAINGMPLFSQANAFTYWQILRKNGDSESSPLFFWLQPY